MDKKRILDAEAQKKKRIKEQQNEMSNTKQCVRTIIKTREN